MRNKSKSNNRNLFVLALTTLSLLGLNNCGEIPTEETTPLDSRSKVDESSNTTGTSNTTNDNLYVKNDKNPDDQLQQTTSKKLQAGESAASVTAGNPQPERVINSIESGFAYLKSHHISNRSYKQQSLDYTLQYQDSTQFSSSILVGNSALISGLTPLNPTIADPVDVRRWIIQPESSPCKYFVEIQDENKVLRNAYYTRCSDSKNSYNIDSNICLDMKEEFLGLRDIGSFKQSFGVKVTCDLPLVALVDGNATRKFVQYEFWYHENSQQLEGKVEEASMRVHHMPAYVTASNPEGFWASAIKTRSYTNTNSYIALAGLAIYVPDVEKTMLKFAATGSDIVSRNEIGTAQCSAAKDDAGLLSIATVRSNSGKSLFNLSVMNSSPTALKLITLTTDTKSNNNNAFYGNLNPSGGLTATPDVTYSQVPNSNGYFEMTISNKSVNINTMFSDILKLGSVVVNSPKVICFGGLKDYSSNQNGEPVELAIVDR